MEYEFEKRANLLKGFANGATRKLLKDFADGNTKHIVDWLEKEEPAHWVLENKGLSPQLTYERLANTKKTLMNINSRSWDNEKDERLYISAKDNIRHFITKLDQEMVKLSERSDVDSTKKMFKYPLMPLPEPLRANPKTTDKPERETISSDDGRKAHGEKEAIQEFWRKNKEKYLVAENTRNDYYNASAIARQVKDNGEFSSSLGTIKDHAGLHKYSNMKHSSGETRTKF